MSTVEAMTRTKVHVGEPLPPASTEKTEKTEKEKALRELDAALAESMAYEESREEEATMRRVRLTDAREERALAFRKLNDATLAKVVALFARQPTGDAAAALGKAVEDYEKAASKLRAGPSFDLDAPLCVSCKTFHGLDEWDGLCSRCRTLADSELSLAVATTCGASFVRAKLSRVFARRRKFLQVPSESATASGRQLLERRLANLRKKGFDVKADGACQFRSIAHQLWENEDHAPIVRQRVIAYLEAHPPPIHDCEVYVSPSSLGGRLGDSRPGVTTVGDDVDAYLAAMRLDTSWGDATTLQACADVFKVRILLVTTFDEQFELVIEPEHEPATQEIWIGFFAEMHYISVVPA
mmetsp:Transcript_19934/g.64195  ORF Transcript_19934/g.64195 Transcript_19934/m.64195 type:complete len:354 (+) Transcript_19934:90-1151(+)